MVGSMAFSERPLHPKCKSIVAFLGLTHQYIFVHPPFPFYFVQFSHLKLVIILFSIESLLQSVPKVHMAFDKHTYMFPIPAAWKHLQTGLQLEELYGLCHLKCLRGVWGPTSLEILIASLVRSVSFCPSC